MFEPEYFVSVLTKAIPVRLAARSFIIPVPKGIGAPLVYPFDIGEHPEMKKGTPMLNSQGEPQGTGLIFTNYTDGALQAVRDDGTKMIIVNALSEDQATQLFSHYNQAIPIPEKATAHDILSVLEFAHDTLGIEDFYDGKRRKIPEFEPVSLHLHHQECGLFIRRSDEERFALLGLGSGTYKGPADSPQRFEGDVVVVTNGKYTWMVQTKAFLNTYRHPHDREIATNELPGFVMQEGIQPVQAKTPSPA